MQVLFKERNNNLVWKDAIYKEREFRSPDDESPYLYQNIYAIKNDNRRKIVICSGCGKEVPNTPSAINAHRNMINKPNKCFECSYLYPTETKVASQKYTLNEDGTYTESTKRNVKLTCRKGYYYHDINSDESKQKCKYAKCENATFNRIEDFWTQHPKAFEEFITIDRIIDAGYKSMYKNTNDIEFELKSKANLTAHVNNQGICYAFTFRRRNRCYTLRYSKKYDKVWAVDARYYFRELHTLDIPENTIEIITKKLKTLYK